MSKHDKASLDARIRDVVARRARHQARDAHDRTRPPEPAAYPAPVRVWEWINSLAFRVVRRRVLALGLIVTGALLVLWMSLTLGHYDAVGEIRLLSDYKAQPITDMAVDDRYVYLATDGNGLQRYDKQTYLWKTFTVPRAEENPSNSLSEVVHDPINRRLWLLSQEKNIFTVPDGLSSRDFETVLKTGTTWEYFDLEADLRQAFLADDGARLYFGSAGHGAAAYHIPSHTWTPFEGASDTVRFLLPREQTVWVAGNTGVHAFDRIDGSPTAGTLSGEDVRHFALGDSLHTAVNAKDAVFARIDTGWTAPFGGGQGLRGIDAASVTRALMTPEHHLIVAAEGRGLARYDTTRHRWHTLAETGERYRQLAVLNGQLLVAADSGLRVLEYEDRFAESRRLNGTQRVRLQHKNDTQLFYSTEDQALWKYAGLQNRQLIDAPAALGPPGAVRNVLAARRQGRPGFWIATANEGLLRYDSDLRRLEQGAYSFIDGRTQPIDQLFQNGSGLMARIGRLIFYYTGGSSWALSPGRLGTKHVIPVAAARFYFLKNDGSLEATNASETYFNGQTEPLLTTAPPAIEGQPDRPPPPMPGEVDRVSGMVYMALPGEAVWAYRQDRQQWQRLVVGVPADLQNMHWTDERWSLVTHAGRLYIADDTARAADGSARVASVPAFRPDPLPGPLHRVADATALFNNAQVLMAWPDRLARYNPGTGRWRVNPLRLPAADTFEQLTVWQRDLYARTAANHLWVRQGGQNAPGDQWTPVSFSDSAIAQLDFGQNNIWYRFDDNSAGRFAATHTHAAPEDTERFFTGSFPGLERATHLINEDERYVWVLSNDAVGRYDTRWHHWHHKAFQFAALPGEAVRQAHFADRWLYVITNRRLIRFMMAGDRIDFQTKSFTGKTPMLFVPYGQTLRLWLKNGDQIEQVDAALAWQQAPGPVFQGGRFAGDLNQLVDARARGEGLWVIDRAGHIGLYNPRAHAWRNRALPPGETPIRFIPLAEHVLLETRRADPAQRHLYRYDVARDTLHRLDACRNRPAFHYYAPGGPVLLVCKDGAVAQVNERPGSLRLDPLPSLSGATRLDFIFTENTFVGLFADSSGTRRVLFGDTLAVALPASAGGMQRLHHVKQDAAGRLWILGDDQRLYVARFRNLSSIDRQNLDPRHFERKLRTGAPAIDFAAELWGGQAPLITGFAVQDPSTNVNVMIATPSTVYTFFVPLLRLPSERRRAALPRGRKQVEHVYAPPGGRLIIAQANRFYQLRDGRSWWRRPFSLAAGYNLGDWESIDAVAVPEVRPKPLDEAFAPSDPASARWRITRSGSGALRFAYRPGETFKDLRHDTHTFLKDHILSAASVSPRETFLYTGDGLMVYDVGREQVVGEWQTTTGQPLAGLDTLLSKPTGETAQPALWARHDGQWKQIVRVDSAEVRLEPGAYAYVARRTAGEAVQWQQTTSATTAITLGGVPAVTSGRLITDVLTDMAVLDSTVFYSTPAGTWWGSEQAGVPGWRFETTLSDARFRKTLDGRLIAQTAAGFFELAASGPMQPTDAPPPGPTRALRRNIEIDGTRWQIEEGRPGLRAFSGNAVRRQDTTTMAFADDIVRDAVYDEDRGTYWVATQGGLWRFDPRIGRAKRETVFAPETDFRRLFKDGRRLYAIDAAGRVYALQSGRWRRAGDIAPDRLVKTFDNGRIRFAQDHTNRVHMARVPGQRGAVWTRHRRGWQLAGDALNNAARVDRDLWTYAPDLGFARYPLGDFSAADVVLQPPEPMPARIEFFKPPNADTLYARDPATDRFWRLIDDRLEPGTARDWARSYVETAEGALVWERASPGSPTLTMKINGVPVPAAFSNRRLVFDDFRSVFAPDENTVLLGNTAGLFEFAQTPARGLRLVDFAPLEDGVDAITEDGGRFYVRTGSGEARRFDPVRNTFAAATGDSLFRQPQPVLRFEDGRFVLGNERRAIPAFAGTLESAVSGGRALFTPEGTFGFDAYTAMLPLTDSTWLGATAWGLIEATASAEGAHQPTAFHRFDRAFDADVETIRDIRRRDDTVYLQGRDALGRDVFFTWNGRRAQPYDEAALQIFAHPQVTFHPHDVKWNQDTAPHTDSTVLKLIGDPGYPLYIEDEAEPGQGRFAFDDIQSIWAYDNLLWAGSKGGLLQFRYLPGDASDDPARLVFETIYTEQTNLAAYHVQDVQRGARAEPSVDLRQKMPGDTLVKQTLVLGDWNARTLDDALAPAGSVGNLTVEQDALGFRTRLRTGAGDAMLEGYAFGQPPGKTARLGSIIFFVATDSLLFAYDETTNTSRRISVVYAADGRRPAETLRPPLALAQVNHQIVVIDGAEQVFTLQPGPPPGTAATREALRGTRRAALGEIDFYVQDGQLVAEGGGVPRMRLTGDASRYAVAAREGKFFVYTSPRQYAVWSYEGGTYTQSFGGDGAFVTYVVKPGDTIYGIIAAQGLASGQAGNATVERIKTQIINRNRGKPALYFVNGDARLRVSEPIEIPGAAAPSARRPAKGYFYWSDRDSVRLETPPVDLITRALYAEDSTHSVFWTGERFVEVERKRNLAQQYYPPDSVAVWSLRQHGDGPFILLPKNLGQPPAHYFERERLRLRTWEGPAWDPFLERRVEVAVQGAPVRYRVTPRRLLEREGAIVRETDDWRQPYPIRRIVALEKGPRQLWVATWDRLIRVDPH